MTLGRALTIFDSGLKPWTQLHCTGGFCEGFRGGERSFKIEKAGSSKSKARNCIPHALGRGCNAVVFVSVFDFASSTGTPSKVFAVEDGTRVCAVRRASAH
eukprot:3799308-Rhodomonas_salina.2